MTKQKKKKNLTLLLFLASIILMVPILIYIVTCTFGISGINSFCVQFLEKVGAIENYTKSSILKGMEMVVGGSIIIPMDISTEATTISITTKGI